MASSATNPADDLEAAVAHHRAGRTAEAERGYEGVLAADPDNLRALNNLGLLRLQARDLPRALPLLAKAHRLAPPGHPAWISYLQGLIAAEQFNTAEDLLAGKDGPEAQALASRLHQAWGMAMLDKAEDAAAAEHFRIVLERLPDDPDAHADLGLAELRQDRIAEAVASFQRALALKPDHLQALVNLGSALRLQGELDAAADCYRRALARQPDHSAAAHNLAGILRQQGRTEELAALPADAAPVGGSPAALVLARGDMLADRLQFAEALECYAEAAKDEALAHRALIQAAAVEEAMGRHAEALQTLNRAIALKPDDPEAYAPRALVRLAMCDFAGGWADYEQRLRSEGFAPGGRAITWQVRQRLQADPSREQIAGRRVLLIAEQGIGDEVMFASCIPDLMALAGSVTCICEPRLQRLFAQSFPAVRVLGAGTPEAVAAAQSGDAFDILLAMGSLGRLFRNAIEAFPGTPYLAPRAEVRERWADRLGSRHGRLRVGVSWRGGVQKTGAVRRSLTLDQLAPILDLPDCEFVSLQYGDVAAELAAANAGRKAPILSFPAAGIDDFEELAGLVLALDVVVSVQTALVHLCGALGADCLAMLTHRPEWRYTLSAPAMPWYRSVRLFRQPEPGAWDPVIARVAQAVRDRAAA